MSDKTSSELLTVSVLAVLFFIVGFFYDVFVSGYVAMKLWSWFVVPIFNFRSLDLYESWAISLVISFFTHKYSTSNCKDERGTDEKLMSFVGMLIYPWMILLLGWMGKSFLF